MNEGHHQCEAHGRVQAIERLGQKPVCPYCRKPVILRIKWLPR